MSVEELPNCGWKCYDYRRQCLKGNFPGIKWPEREADHPPSSAEVNNGGVIHPPYVLMA
jgi:hypothetical protein